jgi:polyhydroxyalkanoate synthesis regulator phasin
MEMFERATRLKLRFDSTKGKISVEDLWDLPMSKLDKMAVDLHKDTAGGGGLSYIPKEVKGCVELDTSKLKLEVLKYILGSKVEEYKENSLRISNLVQEQKILETIARKKDKDMGERSIEELEEMLRDLQEGREVKWII